MKQEGTNGKIIQPECNTDLIVHKKAKNITKYEFLIKLFKPLFLMYLKKYIIKNIKIGAEDTFNWNKKSEKNEKVFKFESEKFLLINALNIKIEVIK